MQALADLAVDVTLRPATMDDAQILFDWRNDYETRANSLNTVPVPWEDHCRWLKASLENPRRDLIIAEVEGVPVGTVRIDRGVGTEMSWTVSPARRVKGIGKAMVAKACPPGEVIAQIKAANLASQRIAEHAGFQKIEDGALQLWKRG